jgi:hypothetical protein
VSRIASVTVFPPDALSNTSFRAICRSYFGAVDQRGQPHNKDAGPRVTTERFVGRPGHAGVQAGPGAGVQRAEARGASLLSLALFDVVGPLGVYYVARSSGASTIVALVLSGLLPAVGDRPQSTAAPPGRLGRDRRPARHPLRGGPWAGERDRPVGADRRDGTDCRIGATCFGSLVTSRPLMFRVALQLIGPESEQGRQFQLMWQHPRFRHGFSVITVVWGATFLVETAAQVAVIGLASISTAKTTSNLVPVVVPGLVMAWTGVYGRRQGARAEREPIAGEPRGPANPDASVV